MEPIRITKLLSERGVCSRREAEKWIDLGLVYLNGKQVTEQGTKALPSDDLQVSDEAQKAQEKKVTVMLHKPLGIVSNLPEDGYVEASCLITKENHWENDPHPFEEITSSLNVVGRLDVNSKGLLLLTQNGQVAKKVIGPDSNLEKEYILRFQGHIREKELALLRSGLFLDGKKLKQAKVELKDQNTLLITLKEGKKRQLRRMCDLIGLEVTSLKRVRVGNLQLGALPSGKWRFVDPSEI